MQESDLKYQWVNSTNLRLSVRRKNQIIKAIVSKCQYNDDSRIKSVRESKDNASGRNAESGMQFSHQ